MGNSVSQYLSTCACTPASSQTSPILKNNFWGIDAAAWLILRTSGKSQRRWRRSFSKANGRHGTLLGMPCQQLHLAALASTARLNVSSQEKMFTIYLNPYRIFVLAN